MTTCCAVLGSPIEHSLSPDLHRAGYAALGLTDWEYQRHRVDIEQLAGFVAALGPNWRGLSLTMPLKEAALQLGTADELSLLAGAANTVIIDQENDAAGHRLYNTDVGGLIDAFTGAGLSTIRTATILGSGATARSAMISVARMGANRVQLVARRVQHARTTLASTAHAVGVELQVFGWPGLADPDTVADTGVPAADTVISTVVAGAADSLAAAASRAAPVIFDVIYDPWPTELAQAAQRCGRSVLNGLDLLVHQAVGQLELMTGRRVSPDVLWQAGRARLSAL